MFKPYNKAEITFDLITEIGQAGRNSKTFVSKDHQLDAEIVIKQIPKARLASTVNFFDESKALYASAHPNVVQIHYACHDTDNVYLAMPYYRKGSVTGLITGKHMTVREIVTGGCQVLSGLHNIHSKGLIHFDVKPDNILLSDRQEALLSDFGLAKQMNLSGVAVQDRLYFKMVAPEATFGDAFDRTFDIYQFGLSLYRMCNGNAAFYAQHATYGAGAAFDRDKFKFDVRNGRFPDRKAFAPHIPSRLRSIIKKCMATDVTGRYQAAIDVANALALVEGPTLDWRLSETPDKRVWTKNENGTCYAFTVYNGGACECLKTVGTGPPRKVSAGCKSLISDADISNFLAST
jgi:eukaryotic-like serine/threonine-protein kinase